MLRLHGRNLRGWLDQRAGREPTVAEKYDYLYGAEELGELAASRPAPAPPRPTRRGHVQQQQRGLPDAERARPEATARTRGAGSRRGARQLAARAPAVGAERAPAGGGALGRRDGEELTVAPTDRIGDVTEPGVPGRVVDDRIIPAGGEWSGVVRRARSSASWTWKAARRWTSSATRRGPERALQRRRHDEVRRDHLPDDGPRSLLRAGAAALHDRRRYLRAPRHDRRLLQRRVEPPPLRSRGHAELPGQLPAGAGAVRARPRRTSSRT